jgi:hypothetical protein
MQFFECIKVHQAFGKERFLVRAHGEGTFDPVKALSKFEAEIRHSI